MRVFPFCPLGCRKIIAALLVFATFALLRKLNISSLGGDFELPDQLAVTGDRGSIDLPDNRTYRQTGFVRKWAGLATIGAATYGEWNDGFRAEKARIVCGRW